MKLNWETGFQPRTTHSLQLPYEEYVYALDMAKDIGDCSSRLIRLPNNMIALCIQDMGAKQAAASLSINIGSLADPPELQGLAHLLEHMLFMGSEKYPDKNEYKSYITDNFGFPNATT
ncbi:metalloprotease, partial [Kickxella alabastrina]